MGNNNLLGAGTLTNPLQIGNTLGFSPQITLSVTGPPKSASNIAELLPLVTLNSDKLDKPYLGFFGVGKKYLGSVAISLGKNLESTAESVMKLATNPIGTIEDIAEAMDKLPELKDYIVGYCEKFPDLSAEEIAEDLGVITSEILVFWAGGWTKIISKTSGAVSKIGKAAMKVGKLSPNLKNFKLLELNFLEKHGFNAHALKYKILGPKAEIKLFDLYKDTKTGEILILRKGGIGEPISTGEYI